MGYKNNTQKFTFLTNATNTNNIITGDLGKLDLNEISLTNLVFNTNGNLNMNCGTISNVRLITGCNGIININASTNVNISASNRISLTSGVDISIPNNIPVLFGSSGSLINENTIGNIILTSNKNISLLTQSGGSIITSSKITFDGTSSGNQSIFNENSGMVITSNKNISFTTSGGNVVLPRNNTLNHTQSSLQFGTVSSEIISGGINGILILSNSTLGNLNLISLNAINLTSTTGNINIKTLNGDINLFSSNGNVRLTSQLIFGINGTSNSIGLNTTNNLIINGNNSNSIELKNAINFNINLSSGGNINIPNNIKLNIGNTGDTFGNITLVSDTSNNLKLSNLIGDLNYFVNGNINTTTSNFNIKTNSSNISCSSFIISGSTGSITLIDTQNVKIKDPILSISNYISTLSDVSDKGIEYNYYNNTLNTNKLGWFGYKSSTGFFTFYSDAINTNEVITGTLGQIQLGSAVVSNSVTFLNTGNIDMNCGTISNLNTITGCNGSINIRATSNTNISSNNIFLTSSKVQIPFNTPIVFGDTTNTISSDSNGNMTLSSPSKIILNSNLN
jgi:hypothetical protein